jgi:pimeloyl-ACP methyl ester carboxylesterase
MRSPAVSYEVRTEEGIVRNRCLTLIAFGLALALSSPTRAQERPASNAEDLRKLDSLFDLVRARGAADYAMSAPNGIDEAKYLKVGGIEQWVTIRGEDRANPVVLVLHGGPGDATNPWGYAGFRTWLKTYTVVQWDQRGAGRTLSRNGRDSAAAVSIDRLVQDGVELAEVLRTSLGKDKIILLGHSWGSVLGVLMAKAKPDAFSAFVGTGQVGDPARGYYVAFDALLAKARELGDARAVRELQEAGPPPYKDGRGYQVQRRWSNLFEGADAFISSMLGFALRAPGYTIRDVNDWADGQGLSAERLVPQSSALTATALTGRFAVPVFVIQGAEDFTTPTSLAKTFVDSVEAPKKAFVTIKGGHFAVFMNTSDFLKELGVLLGPEPRPRP